METRDILSIASFHQAEIWARNDFSDWRPERMDNRKACDGKPPRTSGGDRVREWQLGDSRNGTCV